MINPFLSRYWRVRGMSASFYSIHLYEPLCPYGVAASPSPSRKSTKVRPHISNGQDTCLSPYTFPCRVHLSKKFLAMRFDCYRPAGQTWCSGTSVLDLIGCLDSQVAWYLCIRIRSGKALQRFRDRAASY